MNLGEFRRVLRQAFIVPLLAVLILGSIVLWQTIQTQKAQHALTQSDRIRNRVNELERYIIDQETGLRGYELTGDKAMLQPYTAAATPINKDFDLLRTLVADNPEQQANLAEIHDRYQVWLGFVQNLLATPKETLNPAINHRGKDLMDALRAALFKMSHTEDGIRHGRRLDTESMERQEEIVIIAGAIIVGLLLATFSLARLRQVSRAYQSSLDELKRKSDEIYESREWLHTTLRSIGDAVIVCAADSSVEFMNSVAEELTGWSQEDAKGQPLQKVFHIIHEQTREAAENPVEKVRRLNKVIGLANHTALIARDGATEYIIDDSAAPIYDKNQTLIGIVLVFRDVTEQRRTEAALIASEKLAVAGRLAASIAHEIHNPLDSVANLHYLLAREDDPEKRREYLEMAQQELGRTTQISRTMLNLYREPNAPVRIDMRELLESVLLLLQRRLENQRVTVEHVIEGSFYVEGFPAELRQVFTNLILNAADAVGPDGKIRLRMTGVPSQEFHGAGVQVEVIDSGPGIPENIAQKLFQPFFTTKGDKGTGLGLWVSMGIVQKHGGTIRARNSEDPDMHGASITVFLPTQTLATPLSRSTAHI